MSEQDGVNFYVAGQIVHWQTDQLTAFPLIFYSFILCKEGFHLGVLQSEEQPFIIPMAGLYDTRIA